MLVLIAALSKELGWHRLSSIHFLLSWLLLTVLGILLMLDSAFDAQLVYYTVVNHSARLRLLVLLNLSRSIVDVHELLLVGLFDIVVVVRLVVVEWGRLVPAGAPVVKAFSIVLSGEDRLLRALLVLCQ